MARTVTVELKMKVSDFQANGAKAIATMEALGAEVKTTGAKTTEFQRLVTANLKDGETAFQSLTRRSTELRTEIDKLRADFAKTGDVGVLGNLKSAESDLRGVTRFLSNMGQEGAQAGETFASSFGKNVSELLPAVLTNPVGLAVVAGVVAVAVPVIGGAVAGAIGAGVGLGLIGAAALIQKNNPQIQAAFGHLKDDAVSVFKSATQPLVGSFVDALNQIDGTLKGQGPRFAAIFAAVEPAIKPVVSDLLALETAILPGLQRTAEGFTKAVSNPEVQKSITGLGNSFTALFNAIGNNPQVIADAFEALNVTLGATASFLDGLVHAASFVDSLFHGSGKNSIQEFGGAAVVAGQQTSQLSGIMVSTHDYALKMGTAADAAGKSVQSMGEHAGTAAQATQATGFAVKSMGEHAGPAGIAMGGLSAAVGATAQQAALAAPNLAALESKLSATTVTSDTLAGQMTDKLLGGLLAVDQASNNFNKSLITLGDTLAANGGHLSDHVKALKKTETGAQQNKDAVLAVVQANLQEYDSQIAVGISAYDAAKAYDQNTQSLKDQLKAGGLTNKQIQGLIGSYEKVPDNVNTTIAVKGLTDAINNLSTTLQELETINGFHAKASVTTTYFTKGKPHTGPLSQSFNRWGGLYQPAADGLLTHAQVYPAVNPGRFMIAEPQTGGEAFIPKNGNYGRSMSILTAAAGWYGAHVVPGGGRSGAAGGSMNITVSAAPNMPQGILNMLRFAVQQNGGDPVKALTPR